MRTPLLVLLLALLTCCTLLFAFGIVTMPGSGLDRDEGGEAPSGPLDASSGDVDASRLRGRPGRGPDGGEPGSGPRPDGGSTGAGDAPSWLVHGRTPGGARLAGRVVEGAGLVPVSGARVRLARPNALFTYLRADPRGRFDELEARTEEDGRFSFHDITPARGYVVRATAGEHAAVSAGPLDLRGRPTRDLGDVVLGPRARLRGRVVDGEGHGIQGARVATSWLVENPLQIVLAEPDTLPEIEAEVKSGEDGRFEIEGLEPGEKTLVIDAGARGADVVAKVTAVAGDATVVPDIVLAGASFLAGHVTFQGGKAVSGARVFAGAPGSPAVRTTETDADGRWRIDALPEGSLTVGVLVPGLPIHLEQQVDVGRDDVHVALDAVGGVEGRVVRQEGGKPVTSFSVHLFPTEENDDPMEGYVQKLIAQILGPLPVEREDGIFEIAPVPAGAYVARVTAEGHPAVTSDVFEVRAGEKSQVRVALPAGIGLEGRVVSARGEGVAGARVHLFPEALKSMEVADLEEWVQDGTPAAVTGPEGGFLLPPQTPGAYQLIALHEEHQPGIALGVDLRVGGGTPIEIRLAESGGLRARVLDDAGRPASYVEMALVYADGARYFFETDDQGRFERASLPTGTALALWYSLPVTPRVQGIRAKADPEVRQAVWDALRADAQPVEIVPGRQADLTVRLPRRVRVHGTLRIGGTLATEDNYVYCTMDDVGRGKGRRCRSDGTYELLIAPGTYEIHAANEAWDWTGTKVVVPETAELRVDLER